MLTEINGEKIDFHKFMQNSITAKFLLRNTDIIYTNKVSLDLLKLNHLKDIINKNFIALIPPEHIHLFEENVERVKQTKISQSIDIKMIDAQYNLIDVQIKIGSFVHVNEKLIQLNVEDITEKKETQKILIQSEKLSVMGELATGIVHEIRNPLTILKGFSQIIKDINDLSKIKYYISVMDSEIRRIEGIANDLLYFSKPHEQELSCYNLIKIIKDSVFLLESSAFKKHISINFNYSDTVNIKCDDIQLKQVFINLIKNAIEATPINGKISINLKKEKEKNLISIKDNGYGMPLELLNKLGTSFISTKENGTGLGLMVSYNIINNHKGTIFVESHEGIGTTFSIELPMIGKY